MRIPLLLAFLLAAPVAAQGCPEGRATAVLSGANVQAPLYTNGNLFYVGGDDSGYLVPARDSVNAIYAQNLLLAGRVAGQPAGTGAYYGTDGFRPGVTGADGVPPTPDECDAADRIWLVRRADVARFDEGWPATPDLASWPVHLGAPVADGDGVPGNWNPAGGDRPLLSGDVTAFWAMTDSAVPPVRREFSPSINVDVAVEAFAFLNGRPELTSATFYRYTVTNRNDAALTDLTAGFYADVDLGDVYDDAVGTDTTHAMVYVFNYDNDDRTVDGYGHGTAPPAVGIQVLDSPRTDDGQRLGLTFSRHLLDDLYYPISLPQTAEDLLRVLSGRFVDGTPMRECGYWGWGCEGRVVTRVWAGDPVTGAFWSVYDLGPGLPPAEGREIRMMLGSGPVTLAPDSSATWLFAIPYARGTSNLDSITRLRAVAGVFETARDIGLFDATAVLPPAPEPEPFAVAPPAPNPFVGTATLRLRGLPDGVAFRLVARDALGRVVEDAPVAPGATAVEVGAGWAAGVYAVEVWSPAASARFRVVKVR